MNFSPTSGSEKHNSHDESAYTFLDKCDKTQSMKGIKSRKQFSVISEAEEDKEQSQENFYKQQRLEEGEGSIFQKNMPSIYESALGSLLKTAGDYRMLLLKSSSAAGEILKDYLSLQSQMNRYTPSQNMHMSYRPDMSF